MVYPPIYMSDSNTIKNIDFYEKMAQKYDAYFLNYSKDPSFANNQQYFYNSQHMNVDGATAFSIKLATDIGQLQPHLFK